MVLAELVRTPCLLSDGDLDPSEDSPLVVEYSDDEKGEKVLRRTTRHLTHPRLRGGVIIVTRAYGRSRWEVRGHQNIPEENDGMGIGAMTKYNLEILDWKSENPTLIGKDEG